ncbi:phage baseplate assembly protein V [Paenibacillus nicotianae]|uniref:Phage baseplate assembly protein V n=1 Tax=Paenibacillus nicotianae TaxID=1526551 RepID=A0ABW4UZV1_9BACL
MIFPDSYYDSRRRQDARISGVTIGKVTNNTDPEKLARVKLMLEMHHGDFETDWVRVASSMAGSARGSLFIPEVDDEVLVAFHLGDITRPYVIGLLWSKLAVPEPMEDENNRKKIKTKGGHEITFDEAQDKGKMTFKSAKGHQIAMDDGENTVEFTDAAAKHKITLAGGTSGAVTIVSGDTKITLNDQGDITLTSNKSVSISSSQISLEAKGTLDLKSSGPLTIKSDAIVSIKGTLVKVN